MPEAEQPPAAVDDAAIPAILPDAVIPDAMPTDEALEVASASMMVFLAVPLLEELKDAASRARIALDSYCAEVLESHAASRRLPQFRSSSPERARRGSAVSRDGGEDTFPWPETTCRVHLP